MHTGSIVCAIVHGHKSQGPYMFRSCGEKRPGREFYNGFVEYHWFRPAGYHSLYPLVYTQYFV